MVDSYYYLKWEALQLDSKLLKYIKLQNIFTY